MWMMPPPSSSSNINGNIASDHARVNNVNQTINNILNLQSTDAADAVIAAIKRFLKESAPCQISHMFPELGRYLIGEIPDRRTSTREYPHRHHSAKVSHCFVRTATFPELNTFDGNVVEYLARYPDTTTTKRLIDILKRPQAQTFSNWMNSGEVNALVLDVSPGNKQRSGWTTHFTLEVMVRINWSNYMKRPAAASPVLAHFCSAHASRGKQWQEYMLRDLLAQLYRARRETIEENHNCEAPGSDDKAFHAEPTNLITLWELLLHSVDKAGITLLYIILDNFESLQGRVDERIIGKFQENIMAFVAASQARGVLVKLLVTIGSPGTINYFSGFSTISLTQDPRERFKF